VFLLLAASCFFFSSTTSPLSLYISLTRLACSATYIAVVNHTSISRISLPQQQQRKKEAPGILTLFLSSLSIILSAAPTD